MTINIHKIVCCRFCFAAGGQEVKCSGKGSRGAKDRQVIAQTRTNRPVSKFVELR